MKIALLTRNPKLFSHQRLMETAIARGHEIVPIDYLRCYMNITSRKPELRYLGEKLTGFDAVIPRIATISIPPMTEREGEIARALEAYGSDARTPW